MAPYMILQRGNYFTHEVQIRGQTAAVIVLINFESNLNTIISVHSSDW